ncbi:hypothetical protein H4K35_12205 [Myroides sp. NP-2]|uniref:hypothetical protein n=1 Tax=Myroides sp. NP-2 TaxID=2759945 RepID=UPI0015FB4680|nr:hypothetical protein [Myroides sp. NP-2]MBB1150862.1 hypothetical protein [Myroides sp. NP-2]
MNYSILFYIGILVALLALVSCSSKQATVTYADEYQTSVTVFQDTVNPQLYYNIDKNLHVIDKGTELPTSRGAN